ncbi:MAG: hypothetical protein ACI9MS_001976 [Glaciecola sp.]|jgi:uncharacterized protein YdiU (UPF0061 family)
MRLYSLSQIPFDNSYARLPEHFYHKVKPTPLPDGQLISSNIGLAQQIGLDPCSINPQQLADLMTGQSDFNGAEPLAMKYAGHQFGQYNPDLGDGRGLLMGESCFVDSGGIEKRYDWHLKGAGKTRFSRMGDGRAVLRSSIREYLVSEAMHGLNIPTTRALALTLSSQHVHREHFEPCATVLRISECHIRFGHFEHFYYQRRYDDLRELADYCIRRYFPEILGISNNKTSTSDKYSLQDGLKPVHYWQFFNNIFHRTVKLVAQWQAYGFVHGVLNTDNISILGESFDYGPFEFMDNWQNNRTPNHSDHQRRYSFANQPGIMQWNLSCLAQALIPLIVTNSDSETDLKKEEIEEETISIDTINTLLSNYPDHFQKAWLKLMAKRLGLSSAPKELCDDLLQLFERLEIDGCRFFYKLSHLTLNDEPFDINAFDLPSAWKNDKGFTQWFKHYWSCLKSDTENNSVNNNSKDDHEEKRLIAMQAVNPKYILRNYMLQEAIESAEKGDYTLVNDLLRLVKNPYAHGALADNSEFIRFAASPPDWARGIELSCSS